MEPPATPPTYITYRTGKIFKTQEFEWFECRTDADLRTHGISFRTDVDFVRRFLYSMQSIAYTKRLPAW